MLAWFGYPNTMQLQDDALGGPEANAIATFRFEHQPRLEGMARFSKTVGLPPGFVMETEAGRVVLSDSPDADITLHPSRQLPGLEIVVRRRAPATRPADPFGRQLENFVAAVRSNTPPMVTATQGLDSLRVIETLYAHRTPIATNWYAPAEAKVVAR